MPNQNAQSAISATAISLVICAVSAAFFLPPLHRYIANSTSMISLIGLTFVVSMIMHFVFVGLTAQRMGRNVATWVVLALIFFPISSIVGLILFEWFSDEKNEPPATSA